MQAVPGPAPKCGRQQHAGRGSARGAWGAYTMSAVGVTSASLVGEDMCEPVVAMLEYAVGWQPPQVPRCSVPFRTRVIERGPSVGCSRCARTCGGIRVRACAWRCANALPALPTRRMRRKGCPEGGGLRATYVSGNRAAHAVVRICSTPRSCLASLGHAHRHSAFDPAPPGEGVHGPEARHNASMHPSRLSSA